MADKNQIKVADAEEDLIQIIKYLDNLDLLRQDTKIFPDNT